MSQSPRSRPTQSDEHAGDARGVADLERRIRDLEARARIAEAERDQLAHACREARAAQLAAEEAMRARDDILAVVTHDLRNPLGTIVMGAAALRQIGGIDDPRTQRIESIAERIQRQGERMARQISDLADLIDIQAGRLSIQRAIYHPRAIVDAASELVEPVARERGLSFRAHIDADLPEVECDCERVVQVLSNLGTCAIKVTARGGAIEVGAHAVDDRSVVFFVRDRSPGGKRDDGASCGSAGYRKRQVSERGAGMGFALARGVVDAHGGQIWTESEPSVGSTVYFSLRPSSN